jgi:hypothetical protein
MLHLSPQQRSARARESQSMSQVEIALGGTSVAPLPSDPPVKPDGSVFQCAEHPGVTIYVSNSLGYISLADEELNWRVRMAALDVSVPPDDGCGMGIAPNQAVAKRVPEVAKVLQGLIAAPRLHAEGRASITLHRWLSAWYRVRIDRESQ